MSERLFLLAAAPFEAACHVDVLPAGHRSRNVHGHSFLARVRTACEPAQGLTGSEVDDLASALRDAVSPLDYSDLNRHLAVPTDENLARWLRERLPTAATIGIESTRDQGVDLDERDHAHLWRRFRFEAAHQLPHVAPGHPCGRMHGHGFEVILHADLDLGERPLGIDFDDLEALWAPLHAELDYACLNDLPGLANPTSEHLAQWLWQRLKPQRPELSWITVYETASAGCHYDGQRFRIWKEQRFEAALTLTRLAAGDRRRRVHGHSYVIRLHLQAPLDEVMGWTVDYGDVKARFRPLYQRLDHHRLDQLDGLDAADTPNLLYWLRARLSEDLPQLDRIDLYQSPGCGALLCWGEHGPALPA